ncbi:class I adenylate-forming enzyme family protein [Halobacteriales archaeon Cl-PHB]
MPSTVDWPTRDLLAHRVDVTPDATAVVDADHQRQFSYAALDELVDGVAARLGSLTDAAALSDPSATARVGTLLSPRLAFLATLHATWRRGNTLVPLSPDRPAGDLQAQVERTDLDLLVCESDSESIAREVADCPVATVDRPSATSVSSLLGSEDTSGDVPETASLDRASEALVLFTSGTTGRPRGVRLTHGNLVASAMASALRLGLDPDERWLSPLPIHHMGGLAPMARSALYGTTAVLQGGFDPDRTAETMRQHRVTGVSLVPTQLRRLLDAGWSPPSHLRFVLLGGAPADAALIERCQAAEVPVCPTYGTTETASQIATAEPETAFAHPETVGQPLLFTDVTIQSNDGEAGVGETGEVVVDGPTVTPGYLDGDGDAFGPSGLHTGDLGYRDEDGRLYVVGRQDDAIQTGGELVQPTAVADALRSHEAVDDAAVVGVPDEEWGERVVALVVAAPDRSVAGDDLRDHCRGQLAAQEVPKEIRVADDVPRTASGTVDRDAVRDYFD